MTDGLKNQSIIHVVYHHFGVYSYNKYYGSACLQCL